MRDAYDRFFKEFGISHDDFFRFGIEEIIHVPVDVAQFEWEKLKRKIRSNSEISIRSYGSKGSGSQLFIDLIEDVFGNSNVVIDKTNNSAPTDVLENLSGYSKKGKRDLDGLSLIHISEPTRPY